MLCEQILAEQHVLKVHISFQMSTDILSNETQVFWFSEFEASVDLNYFILYLELEWHIEEKYCFHYFELRFVDFRVHPFRQNKTISQATWRHFFHSVRKFSLDFLNYIKQFITIAHGQIRACNTFLSPK